MWHVVGHESAVELLRRLVAGDQVPHALLLTGSASIGKTTLALDLARALNCTGDDAPCGRCLHCRHIDAGAHPDVVVVESAEGKDSISIDQVRQLRDAASLRPFQGRRKVYIIARAEQLTAQAADALLKTLEDPQPQVVVVLTAADVDGVPETVVSRCRVLPMRPLPRERMVEALVDRGAEREEAERLSRLARGRSGWAFTALKTPKLVGQLEESTARLAGVLQLSPLERLSLAEVLAGERKDRATLRSNLETLALLWRDALLVGEGLAPLLADEVAAERLREQHRAVGVQGIRQAIEGVRLAMQRIDANVDPRLTLEAMMLGLP